jgi:hypothetical protein
MKNLETKYTKSDIGKIKIINNFLPTTQELALKAKTVKVTIFRKDHTETNP